MDRFEEWMEVTVGVSSREFDRLIDLKRKKCTCPFCPTYTDCAKRGGGRAAVLHHWKEPGLHRHPPDLRLP